MSNIRSLIEGYMNGNAWEDLCVKCYRIRYQNENYTYIPAAQGGDAGIEGFTQNGIVHQCYCPEREYSDDELYAHQRDKLTKDIDKLLNNGERLKKLGVPTIVEWHFDIPEYKDSRIIIHAESKQKEVLKAKSEKRTKLSYISDDFKIVIKIAEDFTPEISRIIRTNLTDMRLNLAIKHQDTLDWSKCDSQKVANIRRKVKAVMNTCDDNNPDLNYIINDYVDFYISGLDIMNTLQLNFPELYEDLYGLEQSYKREVSIRTHMNTNKELNQSLFDKILNDFQQKLENDFSRVLSQASIGELKQDLVASWLADCSMEFRGV